MKVQILGTGCQKCEKLAERTETALKEMGGQYELVKVTDINEIISFGIMMTPGLAIDGEVKLSGRVPTVQELKTILSQ